MHTFFNQYEKGRVSSDQVQKVLDTVQNEFQKRYLNKYTNKVPDYSVNSEIMVYCDKYYALYNGWMNMNNYHDYLWEMFDKS